MFCIGEWGRSSSPALAGLNFLDKKRKEKDGKIGIPVVIKLV